VLDRGLIAIFSVAIFVLLFGKVIRVMQRVRNQSKDVQITYHRRKAV
jgi:hypothetical protein